MRECKIGVGGCGGKIYKSFLAYSDELVGHVLKNMSNMGAEKKLFDRGEEQWKPLFNGLWLDLDRDEVAGLKSVEERDENADYNSGYCYLYNNPDVLTDELSHKMKNLIGYRLDAGGFMHRPELQMIAFANPDISKAICSKIYASFKAIEFESLFFFVGLGGGTGTGVIGNLAGYFTDVMGTMQTSLVLGLLTGKKDYGRKNIRIQATFFRRSFNAIWALSDLVGGKKVTGVLLADNDKLSELGDVKERIRKLKKSETETERDVVNRHVVRSIFPLLGNDELEQIDEAGLRKELAKADFTPIYVPCYWQGKEKLEDLIAKAILEGKLADCDHTTAVGAWVFTKGFMEDPATVKNLVKSGLEMAGVSVTAEELKVWRTKKVGGAHKDREVLILLKSPGIKELLSERIDFALDFIRLIEIVEKIKTGTEETSSLESPDASLKESVERDTEGKMLLARIKAKFEEYLDNSEIERALVRVIADAWEFSNTKNEFKFTEEVIASRGRFIEDFKEELEKVKERIEKGEKHIFPKHVRIKLKDERGYLFSIAAKFCWSDVFTVVYEKEGLLRFLNDDHNIDWAEEEKLLFHMNLGSETELNTDSVSEDLKNKFEKQNFSLSERIVVTKDNEDKWWIADEEKNNTYLIRKEAEKLNIYKGKAKIDEKEKTIRISNMHERDVYAEITLGDNDKKAILTTCDGKISKTHNLKVKNENGKLNIYDEDDAQLLKILEEKSKLLFSMPIGLEEELNKDTASEELNEVFFTEEGVRLSTKNNITPEKGNKWSITDEDKTYFIRKEPEYLNIFELDNDEPLFRMNIGLEAELNKDTVTEKLKNAFPTKDVSLSMNSKITKENGDKWVITDKENQKTYNIRKEPEYLNVYNSYNGVISNEFKAVFVKHKVPISDNDIVTREDVNEWVITREKKKYIIKKVEAEKLNIYEQEIPLEHRVSTLERRFRTSSVNIRKKI
jgi:hypothetical protein